MTIKDPYHILGIPRTATAEDLRKAYRALAKKHHPDLNPGNKDAEASFKEISAAYAFLSDSEQRSRFDRGEIDASGAEKPQAAYYRDFATRGEGAHSYRSTRDAGFDGETHFSGAEDIFADLFGRGGTMRMRGQDLRFQLRINFFDAYHGTSQRITLPEGGTIDVRIPRGIEDGQILRVAGKGGHGIGGGPPGDALIEISVTPDPRFQRKGDDIYLDLQIPLADAVLGGRIHVPTPGGDVTMTLHPGANSGQILRLKGKGMKRHHGGAGDQYVRLLITLPDPIDPALRRLAETWRNKDYESDAVQAAAKENM